MSAVIGWTLGAPSETPGVQAAAVVSIDPPAPPTFVIKTTRRGQHHIIAASIAGPGPQTLVVPLLLDTGASAVALPASMIDRLGYRPGDLQDSLVETANGRIKVKKGRLASVALGGPDDRDVLHDVDVMFISDDALGRPLLGMNVLGRYRVTIDDDKDQIILVRKR